MVCGESDADVHSRFEGVPRVWDVRLAEVRNTVTYIIPFVHEFGSDCSLVATTIEQIYL